MTYIDMCDISKCLCRVAGTIDAFGLLGKSGPGSKKCLDPTKIT